MNPLFLSFWIVKQDTFFIYNQNSMEKVVSFEPWQEAHCSIIELNFDYPNVSRWFAESLQVFLPIQIEFGKSYLQNYSYSFHNTEHKPKSRCVISNQKHHRVVKVLNGKGDVDMQYFIQSVKHAKRRCSQPDMFLSFLLIDRIFRNAKRALDTF